MREPRCWTASILRRGLLTGSQGSAGHPFARYTSRNRARFSADLLGSRTIERGGRSLQELRYVTPLVPAEP